MKINRSSLAIFPVLLAIGAGIAWAGSQGGVQYDGRPVFTLVVALAFAVNWLAFLPAYLLQTEKFFDLTGSLTFLSVTGFALWASAASAPLDARAGLVAVLVGVWAARLGTFLFTRIHRAGKDDRFDEIKPDLFRFLNVWTIQALWVSFTAAPALVVITGGTRGPLDLFAIIGALVWAFGFFIEVVADSQKTRFNADPANRGKFINVGLWARSRHPNYFGEIVLWIGMAIVALPVLHGAQWVAMISPVFVTLLLTRVSGVPMLEAKAERKWGGQPEYETYKRNTPVLVPKL